MKPKDRIALVTGGGSGLARAIALRFAEEGAHVVNELRLGTAEQAVSEVIMEAVSGQGIQTHLDITQNLSDDSWRRTPAVHLAGTFF